MRLAAAVLLLLVAAGAEARIGAPAGDWSRKLTQNTDCPAGCDDNACVLDSSSGGYKCTKCKNLLTVRDDGTCGCPVGRKGADQTCEDCPKGSFCAGGQYTDTNTPSATTCPNGLTTIGKRSATNRACVNLAGNFYKTTNGNPDQEVCPANTYSAGLKKQRACVPCPPGYITRGTGKTSSRDCVVPEGYFLKGPGQIAPCPAGEWKAGFNPDTSCQKCASGVTTTGTASVSAAACNNVLPSFYPVTLDASGAVTATAKCPQKYYCPGGAATVAFNTSTPTVVTGTTMVKCPNQLWTEGLGAVDEQSCLTPPGHYTSGTETQPCADDEYRPEWKAASEADKCVKCGEGIMSTATEQIAQYAFDESQTSVDVRGTAASCYIKAGQGMLFVPSTNSYRAVNCDSGRQYGASNVTFGLAASPCRDCPANMIAPASGDYYVMESGKGGSTSPLACKTEAGFGYNGRAAAACPKGTWSAGGTLEPCAACPNGMTTPSTGATAADACEMLPGWGTYNGGTAMCPVGFYAPGGAAQAEPCTSCGTTRTTKQPGASKLDDCDVCTAGNAGANCATQCGGSNGANYSPGQTSEGDACLDCPAVTAGFFFDFRGTKQDFTPAVVAKDAADSPAHCLLEFAQIQDVAWSLGGAAEPVNDAKNFTACVDACKAEANCQYITFDYAASTNQCTMRKAPASAASGSVIAYKAFIAGDASKAASAGAKALPSGSYTFWADASTDIGTVIRDGATSNYQDCLKDCDADGQCAAVAMTGVTADATQGIAGCKLIKGDASIAKWKRSVTRVVTSKLGVSSAL